MGSAYDGLMHFATSPEDIASVLAFALWAGLRGAQYGRRTLFALPGAWLLGGVVGVSAVGWTGSDVITALWLILLGGLLAANANLSLRAATATAALVGMVHGYLNGTGMVRSVSSYVSMLGVVVAVFVLIAMAAAFIIHSRARWTRIAARAVGSWIAASGLLMLGWAYRSTSI